jgi:hypothetical protein
LRRLLDEPVAWADSWLAELAPHLAAAGGTIESARAQLLSLGYETTAARLPGAPVGVELEKPEPASAPVPVPVARPGWSPAVERGLTKLKL